MSKVPVEKRDEECIMCYNPLKYVLDEGPAVQGGAENNATPINSAINSEGSNLNGDEEGKMEDPLMIKAKNCIVTPCKHYFHQYCFNQWVEVKHECPICRTQLKFYIE